MSNKGRRSELLVVNVAWTETRMPASWTADQRQQFLRRVVQLWLEEGEVPRGFAFTVSWRNPDNKNPEHSNWKSVDVSRLDADEDEQAAARESLNRGGWLSSAVGAMTWNEGSVRGTGRGRRRTR